MNLVLETRYWIEKIQNCTLYNVQRLFVEGFDHISLPFEVTKLRKKVKTKNDGTNLYINENARSLALIKPCSGNWPHFSASSPPEVTKAEDLKLA
jgi:hypothetical protein